MTSFTDPVMQRLADSVQNQIGPLTPIIPASPEEYFPNLAESIMGQQLSEKVVPKIIARVRAALPGELTPETILRTPHETLRSAGLSHAKAQYIRNIAQAWEDNYLIPENLTHLEDEEIISKLSTIKGVGRWTAEMFLIFTLGRPDVFSGGDYGLRRGILQAYRLSEDVRPKELIALSENWKPNRSFASRILWKSLDLPKLSDQP